MKMRRLAAVLGMLLAVCGAVCRPGAAQPLTKVTFGTDWLAEAEHGGFYQALALGFYRRHGLDVTLRQGGPQSNGLQNVAVGLVDVQMISDSFGVLNLARQKIPVVAVAALFQKDPQVLISHPGAGNDTLAEMKGKPIMISAGARNGFWPFLKAKFGFTDEQIRPYNFQMAPFLADKRAIQQGFVTSEPFQIARASGETPVVNLLADAGYAGYCDLLLVRAAMAKEKPEVVRGFVEASIEGWYSYIHGDPSPGNALIMKDNPEMTQATIDYAIRGMKERGLVDSGDALELGVGAMTEARWQTLFETAAQAGLYPKDMDWRAAVSFDFVNKRHGIEMRKP